jgi:hypothetical protein
MAGEQKQVVETPPEALDTDITPDSLLLDTMDAEGKGCVGAASVVIFRSSHSPKELKV